ncbi:MAG: 23S rRNA (uracil(1939)-C(5))-methyltransferase RlmD [Dehalococcoidia bacterium]|nr:23S rRNA (uracil(1939)-C(5))-methyltransferase RlmD [Chloroflexi bacterium CFX7]MCK6564830.1 23S rRNA (uracil(1939)-C(5))-methyltransferase RlmD [Dehalococcoidia bacterium]NUQ56442.1 23S rRNA (uracil(1939)-C(5))-methyltransferase RlmD [Dehalococcoidia bacterium]
MARNRNRTPEGAPLPGDVLTVRIESIVFGGAGLAHLEDGRVVFVSGSIPGELAEATVDRSYPDYTEAAVTRVIEPSPDRVEPRCALFGECGGCQLQHMSYPAQLRAKEAMVREQLRRIGRLDEGRVRPIVGAAEPWGYRNHLRFSTGKKWGDVGFISRRGRGLLKVESCPIADPWVNGLLPHLQGKGAGLHQVQVRHNASTGSFLINPEIRGLHLPSGQKSYLEVLGGHRFAVSAAAFFQVNSAQAEEMVRLVGESLPARGEILVDAFAGVGTFAVVFADRFRSVIAIEESNSAARDARTNFAETPNVSLRVGKVEEVLPLLEVAPDVVLLDPPRPGCAPPVLESIIRFRPSAVVYVSCNPATLARDLRVLVDGGYVLDHVTPLDMFPQTGHVECVSRLTLADPGTPR